MKPDNYKIGGLILKEPDKRNFPLGAVIDLPNPKKLPVEFRLPAVKIKNQGGNDKCAAYASCSASEMQEDCELSPDYLFAVAKKKSGDPEAWGCSLEDILKAHTKVGTIEQREVPENFNVNSTEARYLENWPDLQDKAYLNKKETYFEVKGPYDLFDCIKSAIYHFRNTEQAVLFGVVWSWKLTDVYLTNYKKEGFGHALIAVGWAKRNGKEYIVAQNSAGEGAGELGYHYISRQVINYFAGMYGSFMMTDMAREDAEWYLNNQIKENDDGLTVWFKSVLMKKVIELLNKLLGNKPDVKPEPIIKPIEPKPMTPSQKIYATALTFIGKDASPTDEAPDELGCANTVSAIIRASGYQFAMFTSTYWMYEYLRLSKDWQKVDQPQKGAIIISPTGFGNKRMPNGHVGICGEGDKIMSNRSATGTLELNFTQESWRQRYAAVGGYPVYFYKKV